MDIITKVKARLECKINVTLLALLPNKVVQDTRGLATSSEKIGHEEHSTRNKRAIPLLAIAQGTAAIGGMLTKDITALVDAKRAYSCKVLLFAIRWRLFLCVLLFLLQLCQRFLLLWLCIKCLVTFGECCESVP